MNIPKSEWKVAERPGWFGEERDVKLLGYDEKYGRGNWRLRHKLGAQTLDFNQAVKLYELCYEVDFLHPDRRYIYNDLARRAKNVWIEQLSDVVSGNDYSIQKAHAAHYEDIAIRRIFEKYNLKFQGNELVRIRADSEDLLGKTLSSIHIPFIYSQYIEAPLGNGFHWWDRHKGSLECFWHLNKVLEVRNS